MHVTLVEIIVSEVTHERVEPLIECEEEAKVKL